MLMDVIQSINAVLWVLTNLIIIYIGFVLLVFTAGYYILFDPSATTAGKLVFRFAVSLIGVIALVIVGVFVDPHHGQEWFVYPGDVAWWRPIVRLVIYGYVAFTVTSLAVFLGIRKWRPDLVKTAPDKNAVKTRAETNELPIIKKESSNER